MANTAILVSVVSIWFAVAGISWAATQHAAPAPAADCSSIILTMADCLTYVSGDATVKKPEGSCCSGLKMVLKTDAECLCEAFKNSAQFGVTLNMSRALDLPSACHVSAPPISNCGLSIGSGAAPVISPAGAPTWLSRGNGIAPAPSPGTSGSASLTATVVFALVVALSSFI